jgi:7-carboxy-7-deazaguanine synthase
MGAGGGLVSLRDATLDTNEFRVDSIIGEGPDAGRRCVTIRLAGCNLGCEECDQPTTWGPDVRSGPIRVGMFLDHIDHAAKALPTGAISTIVITGGEPLLQQHCPGMRYLIESCMADKRTVHIETNGTITPAPWLSGLDESGMLRWRVSPKISGSLGSCIQSKRLYLPTLHWFAESPHAEFLFPCINPTVVGNIRDFCGSYDIPPDRVWVYPLGTEALEVAGIGRSLGPAAFHAGLNTSTRLNVIMMGR